MSIKTRHFEKAMLFDFLTLSRELQKNAEVRRLIKKLMAKMEQKDVTIVKGHISELKESK